MKVYDPNVIHFTVYKNKTIHKVKPVTKKTEINPYNSKHLDWSRNTILKGTKINKKV